MGTSYKNFTNLEAAIILCWSPNDYLISTKTNLNKTNKCNLELIIVLAYFHMLVIWTHLLELINLKINCMPLASFEAQRLSKFGRMPSKWAAVPLSRTYKRKLDHKWSRLQGRKTTRQVSIRPHVDSHHAVDKISAHVQKIIIDLDIESSISLTALTLTTARV